jgi:small GTP-binding protein
MHMVSLDYRYQNSDCKSLSPSNFLRSPKNHIGEYDDRQISTIQASYLDKKLMVTGSNVQLSVWDTAGQERFHALGPIYYRDADAALLVYDITDIESFNRVRKWVKELQKIVGNDIIIFIAGNKVDLEKQRGVKNEDAVEYAASVGATHFYTSAKTNRGLEELFLELSKSKFCVIMFYSLSLSLSLSSPRIHTVSLYICFSLVFYSFSA